MRQDEAGRERVVLADLQVDGGREWAAVAQPLEGHGRVPHLHRARDGGAHARHERAEVEGLDRRRDCNGTVREQALKHKAGTEDLITMHVEGGRVGGGGRRGPRLAGVVPGVVRPETFYEEGQHELPEGRDCDARGGGGRGVVMQPAEGDRGVSLRHHTLHCHA